LREQAVHTGEDHDRRNLRQGCRRHGRKQRARRGGRAPFAKAGAKLALGARRTDQLQALAEELGLDRNAVVRTDVTDRAQVKALVDHAVKTHGRIDAIINNAGLMSLAPLELLQVDEWDRMIDVNIKGVLYGIAAALPHMKA
jgi:NADP-dependent 3-hydroxy acid dehydrogenase YdfG